MVLSGIRHENVCCLARIWASINTSEVKRMCRDGSVSTKLANIPCAAISVIQDTGFSIEGKCSIGSMWSCSNFWDALVI